MRNPVHTAYRLFARDSAAWTPPSRRIFAARADQNGRALFPDVPPGEYLLAIVADIETGAWFNPQVLAALAGDATPITVQKGDNPEIAAA